MRRLTACLLGVAAATLIGCATVGEVLTSAAHRSIGPPPEDFDAVQLELPTASGGRVAAWLTSGETGAGVVLLLHGIRADRRDMIARARFLKKLGYGVLMIDLPAHGESTGSRITYGAREAEGVKAALSFLAQREPREKIGVIAVSLGAASFMLSGPSAAADAVILESMYPTIEEAVSDRLRVYLGPFGEKLAPFLLRQIAEKTGVATSRLRPIDEMPRLHCATLIAVGARDRHTTVVETERLFAVTPAPKELWVVDDAAHVDLHAFTPETYEARVGAFFAKYLRRAA